MIHRSRAAAVRALLPAFLLGMTSSASAADITLLASSHATLSNMTFRLVDLDTNDGIAPSVSFISEVEARVSVGSGPPEVTSFTGTNSFPFDRPLSTASSAYGSTPPIVSVGSGGAQAGSQSSMEEMLQVVRDPDPANWLMLGSYASVGSSSPAANFFGVNSSVVLSANTRLIIEGTADIGYAIDLNPLAAALTAAEKAKGVRVVLGTDPYVLLSHQFDGDTNQLTYAGLGGWANPVLSDVGVGWEYTINTDTPTGSGLVRSDAATAPLAFQVDNLQGETRSGTLGWVVQATMGNQVFYEHDVIPPVVVPPVPVVPEPGTWALMALGLCGLGWRVRRQTAQAAGNRT